MGIYNILYFYISMFCTDTCNKQPLGEVLHSVEICFVTSLLNRRLSIYHVYIHVIFKHFIVIDIYNSFRKIAFS